MSMLEHKKYGSIVDSKMVRSAIVLVLFGVSLHAQDGGPLLQSNGQYSAPREVRSSHSPATELSSGQATGSDKKTGGEESALDRQIVTGRLVCAEPLEASQTCGHSKNEPVWGCKLSCAKRPDGYQYALRTVGKTYLVNAGDAKKLKHLTAYDASVSGELSQGVVDGSSILKRPKIKHEQDVVLETKAR